MTITVDQALYGYADGHRQLAASRRLPPPVERRLLVASDVSAGPKGQRSLRAVALPEVGMWALLATWSADEMPRPGSVWTHALLLDEGSVRSLEGAAGLLDALRRPTRNDYDPYKTAVQVGDKDIAPGTTDARLDRLVALALYGRPGRSGAVIFPNLAAGELSLLAAWQQQWPELRMQTTFATRYRIGSGEDVHVQVGTARGRASASKTVVLASEDSEPETPRWVDVLAADERRSSPLGNFFGRFGPQAPRGRAEVPALARIHELCLTGSPKAFAAVAQSYPEPPEMRPLKAALIESADVWNAPLPVRLTALFDGSSAVDWTKLRIERQIKEVTQGEPSTAAAVLAAAFAADLLPEVARSIFATSAEVSSPGVVSALARLDVAAALLQVSQRPTLLASRSVWVPSAPWQEALLNRLSVDEPVRGLGKTLVEAERDDLAEFALLKGLADVQETLAAIAGSRASMKDLVRVEQLLGPDTSSVKRALSSPTLPPAARVLGVLALGRFDSQVVATSAETLTDHLDAADEELALVIASELFNYATISNNHKRIVSRTFPPLHRALVEQRLPERAWRQLDAHLPWPDNWDRAARLRKALLNQIEKGDWTKAEVTAVLRAAGPEAHRIRDLTDKRSDVQKFVDGVVKKISFWD